MNLARSFKVHLRIVELYGAALRVVTLRPQDTVRFSTNYFHDTWHILVGKHGAMVLGRLLWGLAFQRQPGTLVLIDEPHLRPTPFEADRPDPILLVPDGLTAVDDDALRALRIRLRRSPPAPTTIRWHTFGMVPAISASNADPGQYWGFRREHRHLYLREQMSRRAGMVCYTAPQPILREHGLGIYQMRGASYFPLADSHARSYYGIDGEVQYIDDFDRDVSTAIRARREVLGDDAPHRLLAGHARDSGLLREVYDRKRALDAVRSRRRR